MTREEKLQAIRDAAIKANPEINVPIVLDCQREDCTHAMHTAHMSRPIRLADVLLAMKHKQEPIYDAASWKDRPALTAEFNGEVIDILRHYNLSRDDITLQSDPTVDLLYNLLFPNQ